MKNRFGLKPEEYTKEDLEFERGVEKMKLEYELINNDNIELATSIQHTIFPNECAYLHYKYAIETDYKRNRYYIIKK